MMSGRGLAAATHKARQKTNDDAIQIAPSTSSVVAMFVCRSIERTINKIAARGPEFLRLVQRHKFRRVSGHAACSVAGRVSCLRRRTKWHGRQA